jgi:hypothetical protein
VDTPDAAPPSVIGLPDAGAPRVARASSIRRRVELREPGREPRRVLTHVFKLGTRQRLRVRSTTRLLEQQQTLATLVVDAPLEARVLEPDPRGRARFSYALGPVKITAKGDERIRARPDLEALADGTRIAGSAGIAPNGVITDHRFDPPADERAPGAGLALSLLASVVELPAAELGNGARWDVVVDAESDQVSLTETTSYEVTALSAANLRYRVAQRESVSTPDGGAAPDLSASPSQGEWLQRFGHPYPEGKVTIEQAIAETQAGELLVATELRIEARP